MPATWSGNWAAKLWTYRPPKEWPASTLQIPKRQVAGRQGGSEGLGLDPHGVEVGDHARTHDVLPCERASVIRLEDPKIGELPDALAAGARAFGELILHQAVAVHPDLVSGGV